MLPFIVGHNLSSSFMQVWGHKTHTYSELGLQRFSLTDDVRLMLNFSFEAVYSCFI